MFDDIDFNLNRDRSQGVYVLDKCRLAIMS